MIEVGRLVIKTAGRSAGKVGVIVEVVDDTRIVVDGCLKRKSYSIRHFDALKDTVKLAKGASHAAVVKALEGHGITVPITNPKKAGERPKRVRKAKGKPAPKQKKEAALKKEGTVRPVEAVKDAPAAKPAAPAATTDAKPAMLAAPKKE